MVHSTNLYFGIDLINECSEQIWMGKEGRKNTGQRGLGLKRGQKGSLDKMSQRRCKLEKKGQRQREGRGVWSIEKRDREQPLGAGSKG